jgi:hypothetical protein
MTGRVQREGEVCLLVYLEVALDLGRAVERSVLLLLHCEDKGVCMVLESDIDVVHVRRSSTY